MPVNIEICGDVTVAYLEGDIDHHTARKMREEIDRAVDKNLPSLLVLDFGGVTFMDSSGIGLVMGRYKQLSIKRAELAITNPPEHIYKVMKLAGLDRLAKIDKGENKSANSKK